MLDHPLFKTEKDKYLGDHNLDKKDSFFHNPVSKEQSETFNAFKNKEQSEIFNTFKGKDFKDGFSPFSNPENQNQNVNNKEEITPNIKNDGEKIKEIIEETNDNKKEENNFEKEKKEKEREILLVCFEKLAEVLDKQKKYRVAHALHKTCLIINPFCDQFESPHFHSILNPNWRDPFKMENKEKGLEIEKIVILNPLQSNNHLEFTKVLINRHLLLLETQKKKIGEFDRSLVPVLIKIGFWKSLVGNFDEAEKFYQKAISIDSRIYGPESLQVANLIIPLAHLYERKRHFKTAINLYQKSLKIKQSILGVGHLHVGNYIFLSIFFSSFHLSIQNHKKKRIDSS